MLYLAYLFHFWIYGLLCLKRSVFISGVFLYFAAMICDITDLGAFNYCDGVTIDFIDSEVIIKNIETKYRCSYEDGVLGQLNPGHYFFTYESVNYKFSVND